MSQVFLLSIVLIFVMSLTSCTAVNNYYDELKHTSSLRYFVSEEEKLARYQEVCKQIGLTEESEAWEDCLVQARTIDANQAAQRSAANRAAAQQRHQAATAKAMACGANPANC